MSGAATPATHCARSSIEVGKLVSGVGASPDSTESIQRRGKQAYGIAVGGTTSDARFYC